MTNYGESRVTYLIYCIYRVISSINLDVCISCLFDEQIGVDIKIIRLCHLKFSLNIVRHFSLYLFTLNTTPCYITRVV